MVEMVLVNVGLQMGCRQGQAMVVDVVVAEVIVREEVCKEP